MLRLHEMKGEANLPPYMEQNPHKAQKQNQLNDVHNAVTPLRPPGKTEQETKRPTTTTAERFSSITVWADGMVSRSIE
jgi:hypothetical protein